MNVSDGSRLMLAAAILILCGCAVTATTPLNRWDAPPLSKAAEPAGLKRGLYVLASSNVYGFPARNRDNGPPFCLLGPFSQPLGNIAFDGKGRMIVPDYASSTITVYAAPTVPSACGRLLGVIVDAYGPPVDAASLDAVKGRIVVVAGLQVDVCSLRRGCTRSLFGPFLSVPASIALSRDGDCWAEGDEASGPGILDYFKGCDSDGQVTTGYQGGAGNYGWHRHRQVRKHCFDFREL